MRVVHINLTVSESSSAVHLHKALTAKGIESKVIAVRLDNLSGEDYMEIPSPGVLFKVIRYLEGKYIRRNLKYTEYPFNTSYFGYDLTELDAVKEADIIHLHWICGVLNMPGIARLVELGKPVVWTCRDIWAVTGGCHHVYGSCEGYKHDCGGCPYLHEGCRMATKVLNYKRKWLSPQPVTYIAPSRWLKGVVSEDTILSDQRVVHIPNARDFTYFRPYSIAEIEAELDTSVSEFADRINILIGAMDTKSPFKGFAYLEKLMEKVLDDAPDLADRIVVHMVGRSEDVGRVLDRYQVKQWGFIERPAKMAAIYSLCDMFITPSVSDNLPSMVMESLGCETPVLAFDTGGTSDMLQHQVGGYVARYKDTDDFYEGLMWILDHNEANALGKAGRKHMLGEFSYDAVADKHIELYKELLGDHTVG
ncbi:MAG: glycosyltransferase [Lachnospiraceae bacterium]|nr:glycosyltransferase [Lachnospiraceae bacterium]